MDTPENSQNRKPISRRTFLSVTAAASAAMAWKPAWALSELASDEVQIQIAFGSCNMQVLDQSHWKTIGAMNPDLWVWLGDNIYSDYLPKALRWGSYKLIKYNPHYFKFSQKIPIIGTWDDHDFGLNNSGAELPFKDDSQQLFLDFMGFSESDPLRHQRGVYHSRVFEKGGRKIKIVLPDLRYFREPVGERAKLLGEDQWRWLEREIEDTQGVDLVIIGSSSQCVADIQDDDGWDGYPMERERFYQTLAYSAAPVLILSGDRHWGEISRKPMGNSRSGQEWLYDITSSGLTHHVNSAEANPWRVGSVLFENNFGTLQIRLAPNKPARVISEIRRINGSVYSSVEIG